MENSGFLSQSQEPLSWSNERCSISSSSPQSPDRGCNLKWDSCLGLIGQIPSWSFFCFLPSSKSQRTASASSLLYQDAVSDPFPPPFLPSWHFVMEIVPGPSHSYYLFTLSFHQPNLFSHFILKNSEKGS